MYVWQSWYKQYSKIITTKMLRFSPFFCLCWFSHERLPFLHLPAFSVTTFCLPISPQLLHVFFASFCCFLFLFPMILIFLFFLCSFPFPYFLSLSLSLSVYLSPKALSGGAAVGVGGWWVGVLNPLDWRKCRAAQTPPPHSQSMPSFQFWPSPANRGINKLLAPFCQL